MSVPRSQFVLLGTTGPVIAAASIFLQEEPLDVRVIRVTLASRVVGLERILVTDEHGRFLGPALYDPTVSDGRGYTLMLAPGTLTADRRETIRFTLHPVLLHKDLGALPGQVIAVGTIVVDADGIWSSTRYHKATTDVFPAFMTSRSLLTSVENVLGTVQPLVLGADQRLASVRFSGRRSDSTAHLEIVTLHFHVAVTGDVAVSNFRLRADGLTSTVPCTAVGESVTCDNLPADYGSLQDQPRTLTLYADVTGGDTAASVQISLVGSGDITMPGGVTWTDGTSVYDWLDLPQLSVTSTSQR